MSSFSEFKYHLRSTGYTNRRKAMDAVTVILSIISAFFICSFDYSDNGIVQTAISVILIALAIVSLCLIEWAIEYKIMMKGRNKNGN